MIHVDGCSGPTKSIDKGPTDREVQLWNDDLEDIRTSLKIPRSPMDLHLYSNRLEMARNGSYDADFETMEVASMETLKDDGAYIRWLNCPHSCLFLLTGLNHPNAGFNKDLWLSLAVVDFAMTMRENGAKVFFHTVQESQNRPSVILSALAYEILRWDYGIFKSHKQTIKNSINTHSQSTLDLGIGVVRQLLSAWAASNPNKTIYVVVDRVDRCLVPKSSDRKESLRLFLQGLLGVMRTTAGKFKFLLLGEDSCWPEWDLGLWNIGDWEGLLEWRTEWRQGYRVLSV